MASLRIDETFAGRYRILDRLGKGGMGSVYAARDTVLDRVVALKLLETDDEEARIRFVHEGRAIARLNHPAIVRIWDIGSIDGQAYIVQELVPGRTLTETVREHGRLPLPIAVGLMRQIALALAFIHENGVLHRDVKPTNILITPDGEARILDFGVARLVDQSRITMSGLIVGTPSYMAPEQIQGKQTDARAEIFSFGALAFEMLSGQRAFSGESVVSTMSAIVYNDAPRLRTLLPDCPESLDELVADCLQRDPSQRPQSMTDVAAALTSIRDSLPPPDPLFWTERPLEAPYKTPSEPAPEPDAAAGTMIGPVVTPRTTAPTRAQSGLESGTRVGKFTVHELVARGKTGRLYKAFDPVRSRLVGLKVIDAPTSVTTERLMRASRIWLDLRHPNLQTILEVDPGTATTPAFIATELIEGMNLAQLMSQRRLELLESIELMLQTCDALEYMHEHGIVHREVKPQNIVVSQPGLRVTLLDSGLARSTDVAGPMLTVMGAVVGDLRYMPPEQAAGRVDQRSDIYSVGAVLFEMVTRSEFPASASADVPRRLEEPQGLPAKLVTTLKTALSPDADLRYASIREFADSLRTLVPEKLAPVMLSKVVVTLHGIRTHAKWQRAFSEVASRAGLQCRLDRWNFGYFSVFHFVAPWARQAKLAWFRQTYHDEFGEQATSPLSNERPSIIAHSFGTYILGHALMRYPYLRFNKVLLCGSILPEEFPWHMLIERGQVQAVRNEFGMRDIWTRMAQLFVPGTGSSGQRGFSHAHERLEQEEFDYSHSEYFERGHMEDKWLPFIKRRLNFLAPRDRVL